MSVNVYPQEFGMEKTGRITGHQAEDWFRELLKDQTFQLPISVEKLVIALENNLEEHFTRAKDFIARQFLDSDDWISAIRTGEALRISPSVREAYKKSLLDHVLATDLVVKLKNQYGENVVIAVDVTTNPDDEQAKLLKIRGRSNQVNNHFRNFPNVRKQVGIDKHCVIVLIGAEKS
jgi:hypothetical protein